MPDSGAILCIFLRVDDFSVTLDDCKFCTVLLQTETSSFRKMLSYLYTAVHAENNT